MTDQVVQLSPDSTGKKVDTSELTVGANTVERQRMNIADPTAAAGLAAVLNTVPAGTEYGVAVRQVSSATAPMPVQADAVYNTTPPTPTAGSVVPLQADSAGNLKINSRYLTSADIVTVVQPTATNFQAVAWLYDGNGNPISSWTPTGGTFLLKVAGVDVRPLYTGSTAITASGNSGDLVVSQIRNICIDVNISAVSGTTPILNFFLDRKGNTDGIYYQIATLSNANITAVGAFSYDVGPGFPSVAGSLYSRVLGNTIRLRWVVSGATPSFTNTINIWQQSC